MTKTEMIEALVENMPKKEAKLAVDTILLILAEMDPAQVVKMLNKIRARMK